MPDYFGRFPKACMGGWGRQVMLIDPTGQALPCHAAAVIPGMRFDNVRARELSWIWRHSDAFERFRGDAWMPATCRVLSQRAGLRWVPLPSPSAHRKGGGHGSRLQLQPGPLPARDASPSNGRSPHLERLRSAPRANCVMLLARPRFFEPGDSSDCAASHRRSP